MALPSRQLKAVCDSPFLAQWSLSMVTLQAHKIEEDALESESFSMDVCFRRKILMHKVEQQE